MYLRIVSTLVLLLNFYLIQGQSIIQYFNKVALYKVLASGNLEEINIELKLLSNVALPEKQAYEGTLLMKKAGMVAKPVEKLRWFKAGRIKLEEAIIKDSLNSEYRFLRLLIQEHAPKIVKYRSSLADDSKNIESNFTSLSSLLQQVIKEYSKRSGILKIA